MRIFREGPGPHATPFAILGLKMGERYLQVGGGDSRLFAALAGKVGLTGRACAVTDDDTEASDFSKAAAEAGVLAEVEVTGLETLPFEDASFDLVVVNGNKLAQTAGEQRQAMLGAVLRVVRPGGRTVVMERTRSKGLAGLFSSPPPDTDYKAAGGAIGAFERAGFRPVRKLAHVEGVLYVEGLKPAS
jgi:ubiquinone/menaquinone biosynthesis C-methylase UbiE